MEKKGLFRKLRRNALRLAAPWQHPEDGPPREAIDGAPVVLGEEGIDRRRRGKLSIDEAGDDDVIESPAG
jgi:hypothetical protein